MMAERRMLSASIAEDEALNRLSIEAQLLFLMTIPHLDRDGLISGNPRVFFGKVCPLRDELRDRILSLINEWVDQGLVIRYDSGNGPVLFFKSFRRHQIGLKYTRDKASRFPPPPGWIRTPEGLVPEDPYLAMTLAESFDIRSEYRRVLLKHTVAGNLSVADEYLTETTSRQDPDEIPTTSGSLPDVVGTKIKINRNNDDDGQIDISPATVNCDGGGAGGGDASEEDLRAFCLILVNKVFGETTWDGVVEYVEKLMYDDLLRLIGWLWKCVVRPKWSRTIGVGFIRSMMVKGAAASLTADERQAMADALDVFVDSGVLSVVIEENDLRHRYVPKEYEDVIVWRAEEER
jgi:hypothetical protein